MFIPKEEYEKILKKIPISCIDLIIVNPKKEFLIIKRKNNPAKNKWWIPGGRILKNEIFKDAALRISKKETGLNCNFIKIMGVVETRFKESAFNNKNGTHTINIIALMESSDKDVKLDEQSLEYKWIGKIKELEDSYPEAKPFLIKAGFN
ncbi:NUDIX domain-containing protein [Candidatus Babeliales bacterium]|nr:NUDIX domain-containing protein [Candidatus Babeliales bacterium]